MATTTNVFSANLNPAQAKATARRALRRSIDSQSWHAMVTLNHAIQYLADDFVTCGGTLMDSRGQVDAIQLLMRVNREVYLECPKAPTFWQWMKSSFLKLSGVATRRQVAKIAG